MQIKKCNSVTRVFDPAKSRNLKSRSSWPALCEAIPTVDGPSFRRLERHFSLSAAICAYGLMHLSWATSKRPSLHFISSYSKYKDSLKIVVFLTKQQMMNL